ncbi:hypothetical protein EVAR_96688_1 [Eumeta japonica]|uniref:Uncharacterized protein n=1 Tax=Eumeta variegata TaxID=151549 RepID=A0A4C1WIX6_EUMVA|nr:hypothetical protein EVAR_96688_1 [Eumeta japonica]
MEHRRGGRLAPADNKISRDIKQKHSLELCCLCRAEKSTNDFQKLYIRMQFIGNLKARAHSYRPPVTAPRSHEKDNTRAPPAPRPRARTPKNQ